MPDPVLSIVVATRNRRESFTRFISSLAVTASVPTHLIVVDASDETGSYSGEVCGDLLSANDASAPAVVDWKVLHEKPRLGVLKGYNFGFRNSIGRYCAWFNDDCELLRGWDEIAVDFMERHSVVGCGCIYWRDPGGSFYLQTLNNLVYPNFGIVRRDVGNLVGWFDEREVFVPEANKSIGLSMYGCDTSIAYSIIDAGYAVVGIPGCRVEHHRERDEERINNYREHEASGHHLPGAILRELWGGIGGFCQLRAKHSKYDYLKAPIQE